MKNNKIYYQTYLVTLLLLLFSCTKEVLVDDLTFQKQLIGGVGSYQNTQKTWKLDSCAFGGINHPLKPDEKEYTMTYFQNGTFKDSDGYHGSWNVPNLDELVVYYPTPSDSALYSIIEVNSAQFKIKLTKQVRKSVVYTPPASEEYFFKIAD